MAPAQKAPVRAPAKAAPAKAGRMPPPAAPGVPGIPANSPLLQPSQTLSGPQLASSAQQIANVQTQGPLTELAKQIAQNNAQGAAAQKQTFGYYMTLAKQAQDAVNQEKGNATGLNSTLQGIDQGTQQQLAGFGQQAQQGALGRMNALGLGGDSSAQLAGETARLQGLGALNGQAFRDAGASQGGAYTGNAISNLGTFNLRGQERLGDIGRATRLANAPLSSKEAALVASRGALAATALGQLRSQERNYSIAKQGLGIKGDAITAANLRTAAEIKAANARNAATIQGANQRNSATNTAANQRSANSIAAANQRNSANIQDRQDRQTIAIANKNAQTGAGATKPLTASQNSRALGVLNKAIGVITQAQHVKNPDGSAKYTEAQIRALTAAKYGVPDYLVEAAYELLGYWRLAPRTAAAMHRAGIRGGTFRGKPIVVSKGQGKQKTGALGGSLFGIPV